MKMSRDVADTTIVCRSRFITRVVTFGRTMMKQMDTAKVVTHLVAGQLCLCLWQVRHIDVHSDMHNPHGDADVHSPHAFFLGRGSV